MIPQASDGFSISGLKWRLTFLYLVILSLGAGLLFRASWVQIRGDDRLERLARRQFQGVINVDPRRGLILDRHGTPLVTNRETYSLAASPKVLQQNPRTAYWARLLAKSLSIPIAPLKKRLKDPRDFLWIKRHLTDAEVHALKRLSLADPHGTTQQGFWLIRESQRAYPQGGLASGILGKVNIDGVGLEGVELWKDSTLGGERAPVKTVRDALGRPTFLDVAEVRQVRDGAPTTLTLDASLQFAAEEELAHTLQETGARWGTVLIIDSSNGEILALAEKNRGHPEWDRRLRSIVDAFEPGSILKPLLVAGALEHGARITDSFWGGRGSIEVGGHKISEAEAHEKFEWITLAEMLQHSSNVVAARLALKLGATQVLENYRKIGLGSAPGTRFPGEVGGWIPRNPKLVKPLELATMGFGQGLTASPLQMARMYAILANGGRSIQPTFLPAEANTPTRIFSESTVHELEKALVRVTQDSGTGKRAAIPGYLIAGKTGTAQMVDAKTKKYSKEHYLTSFIGYAVDPGHPRPIVAAYVEAPRGVYYASETAAPLFRRVYERVLHHQQIPATHPIEQAPLAQLGPQAQSPSVQTPQPKNTESTNKTISAPTPEFSAIPSTNTAQPMQWTVPDLRGLSLREVIRTLPHRRVQLKVHGSGLVIQQVPASGGVLHPGSTLSLKLAE